MSDTIEELSKLDKNELIKQLLELKKTKEVLKKQIMFRLLIKMFMKILINNKKIKNLI